jgi:hypothetical protein
MHSRGDTQPAGAGSDAESKSASPAVPGISGKKLTLGLIISLLLVGGVLSYVLWTYNRVDAVRRQREDAWQQLADALSDRYRSAEREVAQGVDAREIDMELGEKFRLAIERFRSTSQLDGQLAAALEMEQLLEKSDLTRRLNQSAAQPLQDYNQTVQALDRLLTTAGGKILLLFLNFSEPVEFPAPNAIRS